MFNRTRRFFCFVIAVGLSIIPATRQQCGGSCGGSVEISVTQFGSVVIPCGNVVPSNNTRVNYCNETSNSPLALGTDVPYNLTEAQIYQNGNTLYCAPHMQNMIHCYRLNISYAPYVPSDYRPVVIGSENINRQIALECPLISNPPPICNWSRYDVNNTRRPDFLSLEMGYDAGTNNCSVAFFPVREAHSGLYECTASNSIGSTTYTFPERFIIENCSLLAMSSSKLALNRPPSNLSVGDNTTLTCRVSSVTRRTTLMWTVDSITYNTSGTFNTSRGQIVLSYSTFDSAVTCSKSSNLTILNVSTDSEGIYKCTAIDHNSTTTSNVSLTLSSSIQRSSASGSAAVTGGALVGAASILFVLVVLLVMASSSYRHHKRIQLRNQLHEPEYDYEFDIFMSFAKTETEQAELIFKALENSHNYRVVWHHRDFTIGVPSEQNMEDYIMKSRKVILALSPGFLESDHCKNEFALSYGRLEDNEENCIIPVVISPCTIPKEIRFLKSLRYTDGNNFSNFMNRLIEHLGDPISEVEECINGLSTAENNIRRS